MTGVLTAVIVAKSGFSGTPVPASQISYTVDINMPDGSILQMSQVKPHNERPPAPYVTEGASVGSLALVQFIGGIAQVYITEWPATRRCNP